MLERAAAFREIDHPVQNTTLLELILEVDHQGQRIERFGFERSEIRVCFRPLLGSQLSICPVLRPATKVGDRDDLDRIVGISR